VIQLPASVASFASYVVADTWRGLRSLVAPAESGRSFAGLRPSTLLRSSIAASALYLGSH